MSLLKKTITAAFRLGRSFIRSMWMYLSIYASASLRLASISASASETLPYFSSIIYS
ncbi:MAG: hypothetical protein LBD76_05150 [Prevotellaceae bacterium]|nr:hypothetical protein [Prevotellaceae bacterium]